MHAQFQFFKVRDNANNKNGTVLHLYEPTFQQNFTTVGGTNIPAAFVAPPAIGLFYAVIGYDDTTIGVQTLDKLTLIA